MCTQGQITSQLPALVVTKIKYFVYVFKSRDIFIKSNVLLLFGSVKVFNSKYKKCYLHADSVCFKYYLYSNTV